MSDETPPAKKAARKTVRKKSATKRPAQKSTGSDAAPAETEAQLPLDEPKTDEQAKPQTREPKSGVRDARRETAGEPMPEETIEKLVPAGDAQESKVDSDGSSNRGRQKRKSDSPSSDQDKQDSNERRGRGRGRGGRDRNEKREIKPSVEIDSKDLAKKAWKIFESEVTEEGLALLDDNGLRDYARSSFNAARLFLEEKERLRGREKQAKAEKKNREKSRKNESEED